MFTINKNYEKISSLHKEATALKKTDIHAAIAALKKANSIIHKSGDSWNIEPLLRLPLFLQQAGLFYEAVKEFEKLLASAAHDAEREIPESNRTENTVRSAINFRLWAIYDKMRVAFKRQKLIEKSSEYGELASACRGKGLLYAQLAEEELMEKAKARSPLK